MNKNTLKKIKESLLMSKAELARRANILFYHLVGIAVPWQKKVSASYSFSSISSLISSSFSSLMVILPAAISRRETTMSSFFGE